MLVQAMIMAGGEGVRLRPLTCALPKPLVPLLGEPVMGYALQLLRRHQITDVGATLCFLPRAIRQAFGRGEAYGVKLKYYEETSPMGTAGGMKLAQGHLKNTFVILSGDGISDCDLTAALAFHREKGALATLILRRVHVPLPYGVVITAPDGKITRFVEKPSWSRVFSNLVNTGMYILEPEIFSYIPDTGTPDFGKDIFPALVERGLPVYGWEMASYWCDVGDLRAYLSAQRALLAGETGFPLPPAVHPDARIDPSARLEGACMVGAGTVIGPGAVIRGGVIGRHCVIGPGAVMENVCLWDRATVEEKARLSGCVLCDGAAVRREAEIADGCALGQGAVAGARAHLLPGVKIWPALKAAPDSVLRRSQTGGDSALPQWTAQGAVCDAPEDVCLLCGAYREVLHPRRMLVAHGGNAPLALIAAGEMAQGGVQVLLTETASPLMLPWLVRTLGMDGGAFLTKDRTVRLWDGAGQPLSPRHRAALDAKMRQPSPGGGREAGQVISLTGAEEIYLSRVVPRENHRALYSPVAVFCDRGEIARLAARGLEYMGGRSVRCASVQEAKANSGEVGFLLDEQGALQGIVTDEGALRKEQITLLILSLCQRKQGLYEGPGVPRAAEKLAPLQKADDGGACFAQGMYLLDGLAALFLICDGLKEGPLSALMEGLPPLHTQQKRVACDVEEKGRVLSALCRQTKLSHTLGEGVRIQHDQGCASIVPDEFTGAVKIFSEAESAEFAQELCDFYADQIQRITRGNIP